MKRLFLLTILGLVTWCYFPETRTMLMDVAGPLVVPVARRGAEEEMEQIARNVVEHERLTGTVPNQGEWLPWLEARYKSADMTRDPWNSVYQLELSHDSVTIVSFGPDRTRGTEDDFHVAAPRG